MNPDMSESLSTQLLSCFFRFIRVQWHMPAPGFSRTETGLLLAIARSQRHGLPLRVSDLSRFLHVAAPTVTQYINDLEQRGLVLRNQCKDDKRAVNLELTEKGLETIDSQHAEMRKAFDELVSVLGEEDAATFVACFNKSFEFFDQKQDSIGG